VVLLECDISSGLNYDIRSFFISIIIYNSDNSDNSGNSNAGDSNSIVQIIMLYQRL